MNLVLVLTDRCNRSCSYCYADRDDAGEMTLEVARRSIQLARGRSSTPLRIGFFGGEPLLRFPLLREVADHARRVCAREPSFHLTTNGDALTEEVAEYFGGVDVEVTLSAHDEDPSALRRAARRLLDVGVQPRSVLVATPENSNGLVERIEGQLAAGIETVSISPHFYATWSEEDREVLEEAYHGLAELYLERQRAGRPFRLNQFDLRLGALRSGVPLRATKCKLGPERLIVAPDGSLFPCDRLAVDAACTGTGIGHVDAGLDEERLERLVGERGELPEACDDCEHSITCLGACACVNVHVSGDAGVIPELVCWHESLAGRLTRELLPVVSAEAPARRIRRRFIRLTAGLLVAGSLTAACGEDPVESNEPPEEEPELPKWIAWDGEFHDEFYEVELTDSRGEMGRASLHVKLRMDREQRIDLLQGHEAEIEATLKRLFGTIRISNLTLPEVERGISVALVDELRRILGEDAPIKGVDLRIWTDREHAELLKQLEALGYVGFDD